MLTLTFPFPLNTSVQIGDFVFAKTTSLSGQYSTSSSSVMGVDLVGIITDIQDRETNNSKIIIDNQNFTPTSSDFICFAKSNIVNASSLKGYYAETTFVNNSKEKAELFGVTAEIQQSSK
tara:strand:- start:596 stop:955 length:360 start_codon:yes stop_codon:yes gene_type:complete